MWIRTMTQRERERERYHSRIVFYCVVVLNLNCVVVGLPLLTDWALLASWVVLRGMQTMIWCEVRSGSERDRHKPKTDSLQRSIVFLFFLFFLFAKREKERKIFSEDGVFFFPFGEWATGRKKTKQNGWENRGWFLSLVNTISHPFSFSFLLSFVFFPYFSRPPLSDGLFLPLSLFPRALHHVFFFNFFSFFGHILIFFYFFKVNVRFRLLGENQMEIEMKMKSNIHA